MFIILTPFFYAAMSYLVKNIIVMAGAGISTDAGMSLYQNI